MTTKPYADWLKELDAIKRKGDDGLSTNELAELWKCDVRLARKRIREGLSKGAFTLGRRYMQRINNVIAPVDVYCYKGKNRNVK